MPTSASIERIETQDVKWILVVEKDVRRLARFYTPLSTLTIYSCRLSSSRSSRLKSCKTATWAKASSSPAKVIQTLQRESFSIGSPESFPSELF